MNWKDIPSLASLRAFDALARQGSFSGAARTLNVTHAAISQHVRALEDLLGVSLAERQGQSMKLTPTGETLAVALGEGFERIAEGISDIRRQHANQPVNVTMTPSFAESWLMSRIGEFWAKHPEVDIQLLPTARVVDLRRDDIDIAIRFGNGVWPGHVVTPLLVSPFVVVAAPGVVSDPKDIANHRWFYSLGSHEQVQWSLSIGIDREKVRSDELANNGLVLSAVRAGLGLSIEARTLVQADIEKGALEVLVEGDPEGLGYYLVHRPGQLSPGAEQFRKWIMKRALQPQV